MAHHSYYKELVRNPANFKGTNKDQKIYVGRSTTLHNLLFCTHTLWPNYVTVTFLLVSSSGTNHDLLCLCRVMAKKANKNIEQRILPSLLAIYLYGPTQLTTGAYPSFRSMKRLGILLLLLDGMLVHRRLPPSISSGFPNSSPIPFYTPGWREAL